MILAIDAGQTAYAVGGALGGIATLYGTFRLARKDSADGAAVLLGGWRDFQAETLKEVERVRASLQQQIAELKAEHTAERAEWTRDSAEKQAEIDKLKAQIFILLEGKNRG